MERMVSEPGRRTLGRTGVEVSCFGLGGEGVLRTYARQAEAVELIWRALELGVMLFDTAHSYAASEDYHGMVWGEQPRLRDNVFLCSKSGERSKLGARRDLEMTLRRMKVQHLDLWQIHDVRTEEEWAHISGPGGALEAFVQAHQAGLARFIGITGQYDPAVLESALNDFEFHVVTMPVNIVESALPGFLDKLLPAAVERGTGVLGTKVMAGGMLPGRGYDPGALVRFALSQAVSAVVVGCESVAELEANLAAAEQSPGEEEAGTLQIAGDPAQLATYRKTFHNVNIEEGLPPEMLDES